MFFNNQYLHTMDPFALDFGGGMGIRWYGLAYLTGFVAGYLIIRWIISKGRSDLSPALVGDFVFTVAAGSIIGGRLGYCLFYSPDLFTHFSFDPPFWGVLAIHKGGMASHGGILGVIAGCILFGRQKKLSFLHLADLTTMGGTIGIFFGRIANFINGELPGRICPKDYPFAVRFPQDILTWPHSAPEKLSSLTNAVTALGQSASEFGTLIQRYRYDATKWQQLNDLFDQLIFQVQKGNQAIGEALVTAIDPRYPSQLIAAVLEGLIVFLVLIALWRKPRKPGVVGGVFLSTYAVVRVISEQYRLPDLHIGYQLFGLTRGQWLSLVLLICSLIIVWICARRDSERLGGWGASDAQAKASLSGDSSRGRSE
jgi:phosphatidylglycerol:prolipoprotein diacylglycerol transferase